jgi:hypothetical protein
VVSSEAGVIVCLSRALRSPPSIDCLRCRVSTPILAWAVNAEVSAIDVQVAGIILVIVGVIGCVASLISWSSWGGFGNRDAASGGQNTTTVVER